METGPLRIKSPSATQDLEMQVLRDMARQIVLLRIRKLRGHAIELGKNLPYSWPKLEPVSAEQAASGAITTLVFWPNGRVTVRVNGLLFQLFPAQTESTADSKEPSKN